MDSPFESMSNFAVASSKKAGKPATAYMEKIARQCGKELVYNKRGRIVEKARSMAALSTLKKHGLTEKQMQLKKTGTLTKKRKSPARKSPARKSPVRRKSSSSSGRSASPARRKSARVGGAKTR